MKVESDSGVQPPLDFMVADVYGEIISLSFVPWRRFRLKKLGSTSFVREITLALFRNLLRFLFISRQAWANVILKWQ